MLFNEGRMEQKRRTSLQKRRTWMTECFILVYVAPHFKTQISKTWERDGLEQLGWHWAYVETRLHRLWWLKPQCSVCAEFSRGLRSWFSCEYHVRPCQDALSNLKALRQNWHEPVGLFWVVHRSIFSTEAENYIYGLT